MESMLKPVKPARPVAAYLGGKRNLAKRLTSIIETIPHATYAEAFVGMGGVFLRRRFRPDCEVINDWSGDVANFFRVLQNHYVAFLEMLRFQITSRAEFERLCRIDPTTLTDMQRAARFLYLQRTAFGGKVASRNFGVSLGRGAAFDVTRLGPMLEEVWERLAGVTVERLVWQAFVPRYDRPDTLFYLDPPYFGCEDDYGAGMFSRDEFEELAQVLATLKGRFVLSINDTPETRALFGGFHVVPVGLTYQISGAPTQARELIVTNSR